MSPFGHNGHRLLTLPDQTLNVCTFCWYEYSLPDCIYCCHTRWKHEGSPHQVFQEDDRDDREHHHHDHHDEHHHHQVGGDVNLWREGHDGLPAVDPVPQVLRHLLCLLNKTALRQKYFNLFSVQKTFPSVIESPMSNKTWFYFRLNTFKPVDHWH